MGIRVFAHWGHSYHDFDTRITWAINGGEWKELPQEVASLLLTAHPQKLCNVTDEADPDNHTCAITERMEALEYERRDIQEPPQDTMARVRMSPQNKAKMKAAKKRSLRARRGLN